MTAQRIEGQINEMSSRQAMGLPDKFVATVFDDLSSNMALMQAKAPEKLVALAEDPATVFKTRYAAGMMLALIGDPRISTLSPQIIDVPASRVTLGLAPDRVDSVVEDYSLRGVIREWIEKECPEYSRDISRFGVGKYCVTNMEYRDFLLETDFGEIPSSWEFGLFPAHKSNHPVYTVSVEASDAYCFWLSGKTGRHFRLPTEQEWEYVASNGVQNVFPWGDHFECGLANTAEEGLFRSTPVGIFPGGRTQLGVLDLAGNVEEYTASQYKPYPNGKEVRDDLLVKEGSYRIARGGSFTRFSDLARSTRRHGWYKKDIYVMGFRLAESY